MSGTDEPTGVATLRPRWWPNGVAVGGLVMLLAGAALVGIVAAIPAVRDEAWWLALVGAPFVAVGGVWAFAAGRRGRFKDSARAARNGVPGQATIVAIRQTFTVRRFDPTGVDSYGNTGRAHRVVRFDLDVDAVGVARYRLRVYRWVRVQLISALTVGRRLDVRVLTDHPRRIAVEWPEPEPSTSPELDRPGFGEMLQTGARFLATGLDDPDWVAARVPRMASARVDGIRDTPSNAGSGPMAAYDLTVSIPGQQPYTVRIVDRGPAQEALVGTDVPVTVGPDPRHVAIVWGPAPSR